MTLGAVLRTNEAVAQKMLQGSQSPDPLTLEQIITLGTQDLDVFWRQTFASLGWAYTSPQGPYPYTTEIQTACGVLSLGNAFYCGADHSIYYDLNLMQAVFATENFSDFGALTVLAHEWSHAVQRQMPSADLRYDLTRDKELQADCLAGAYARYLKTGTSPFLSLEAGDLEEGAAFFYAIGDDLPWFDKDAHGSPYERSQNFVVGQHEGLEACYPNLFHLDPDGGFLAHYPPSWQMQHHAQWSSDGQTYYKSFLIAPKQAQHAELNGYLSEGLRLFMEVPQPGHQWTQAHQVAWTNTLIKGVLRNNPGFYVVDSTTVFLSNFAGKRYWLEGTAAQINETERTSFIVVPHPNALMHIELASPASRFDYYANRLEDLIPTFYLQDLHAPE